MRFASSDLAGLCGVAQAKWLVAAALLCLAAPSEAQSLFVICHPSVKLMESELRDVFLGDKQFAGTVHLAPADNRAAQVVFLDRVLMMALPKYTTSWIKKAFRDGLNPLPVTSGDDEAIEYVRTQPGRCSYVTSRPGPGAGVVVVWTLGLAAGASPAYSRTPERVAATHAHLSD